MIQLSSKNANSSLCYDVIITHQKNLQIDNLDDFSSDLDFCIQTDIFRDVFSLTINQ